MKMVRREPGESEQGQDGLCGRKLALHTDTLLCTIFCIHLMKKREGRVFSSPLLH